MRRDIGGFLLAAGLIAAVASTALFVSEGSTSLSRLVSVIALGAIPLGVLMRRYRRDQPGSDR